MPHHGISLEVLVIAAAKSTCMIRSERHSRLNLGLIANTQDMQTLSTGSTSEVHHFPLNQRG